MYVFSWDTIFFQVIYEKKRYFALAAILIILLFMTADITFPYGTNFILAIMRTLVTLLAGYSLICGIILCNIELNGLTSTKKDLIFLAKSNETLIKNKDL